jgi:hypothetical protein
VRRMTLMGASQGVRARRVGGATARSGGGAEPALRGGREYNERWGRDARVPRAKRGVGSPGNERTCVSESGKRARGEGRSDGTERRWSGASAARVVGANAMSGGARSACPPSEARGWDSGCARGSVGAFLFWEARVGREVQRSVRLSGRDRQARGAEWLLYQSEGVEV